MTSDNFELILKDVQGACQRQNPIYPTLVIFQGIFTGLNIHTWAQQHELLDQLHQHLVGVEKAVGIVSQNCEERATKMILETQEMQEKEKAMKEEVKSLEGKLDQIRKECWHMDERIAESKRAIQSSNERVEEAKRGLRDARKHRDDMLWLFFNPIAGGIALAATDSQVSNAEDELKNQETDNRSRKNHKEDLIGKKRLIQSKLSQNESELKKAESRLQNHKVHIHEHYGEHSRHARRLTHYRESQARFAGLQNRSHGLVVSTSRKASVGDGRKLTIFNEVANLADEFTSAAVDYTKKELAELFPAGLEDTSEFKGAVKAVKHFKAVDIPAIQQKYGNACLL